MCWNLNAGCSIGRKNGGGSCPATSCSARDETGTAACKSSEPPSTLRIENNRTPFCAAGKEQQALLLEISRMILEMPVDRGGLDESHLREGRGATRRGSLSELSTGRKDTAPASARRLGCAGSARPSGRSDLPPGTRFSEHVAACGTSLLADADRIASDPRANSCEPWGFEPMPAIP